jgi:hypothetical protein
VGYSQGMGLEPKRSYGPTGTTLKPYFTLHSLSDQFRVDYDPEFDYVDLGHQDQHWARRLFKAKPPYPSARIPEVQVVRNRRVPLPRDEMPQRPEDWWGYTTPRQPGVYVTVARQPAPPSPPGALSRLASRLGFLLRGR